MAIKTYIGQKKNGLTAEVVNPNSRGQGLIAYTDPLVDYTNLTSFFTSDDYGFDMNINPAFGGTPDLIHDGTDNAGWTGSALSGTWTFNDTTAGRIFNGTYAINGSAANNADTASFLRASSVSSDDYVAITGNINIDSWSTQGSDKGVEISLWDGGVQQGSAVRLENYVNIAVQDDFQAFTIPLADFALSGADIDEMRVTNIDVGAGPAPDYWLDVLQLEETGTLAIYEVRPPKGKWYHVTRIRWVMVDALAGSVPNNISYDQFLGVAQLASGINFRRYSQNEVVAAATIRDLYQLIRAGNAELDFFADGTNTTMIVTSTLNEPLILKSEDRDRIEYQINDDLSGLLEFAISVGGRIEDRE